MEEKQDGYRGDDTWLSGQPVSPVVYARPPIIAALVVVCSVGTLAIVVGAIARWWFW